jgi:DNA-binding response OmpR family regulator
MRILVVEDQRALADRIREGLHDQGMAVDVAYDGADALRAVAITRYDVVVLDRDLPRVHGDAVCATIVSGLELGADDYLGKPFAFAELVARVQSLARRTPSTPPVVARGDLVVDRARRRVGRGGRPVALTRKEFGVLETLLDADGAVVSAEELFERVWDANADPFSNTVSVTIGRLRRKLGEPQLITTVVGTGYRL